MSLFISLYISLSAIHGHTSRPSLSNRPIAELVTSQPGVYNHVAVAKWIFENRKTCEIASQVELQMRAFWFKLMQKHAPRVLTKD